MTDERMIDEARKFAALLDATLEVVRRSDRAKIAALERDVARLRGITPPQSLIERANDWLNTYISDMYIGGVFTNTARVRTLAELLSVIDAEATKRAAKIAVETLGGETSKVMAPLVEAAILAGITPP